MGKKYKELTKELRKAAGNSRRYSKTDYVELTQGLLNEPDHEVTYYTNPSADTPVAVTKKPVENYREALKDVVKQFGVDKNELSKLDTMEFTKKHAEALTDVAQVAQHDYIESGKKLRLPQFCENETTVTLGYETLPEKVEATNKIEGGKSVPTGKTIKTASRNVVKAANKVPAWLKSEV